jgi:ribose-phosphate pyrophosphokinase
MRLRTALGDLAYKAMTFPDGARHIEVPVADDKPFVRQVTIETAIRNEMDLFDVLLAANALTLMSHRVSLDIRYLTAARMDRRIGPGHPESLRVVCAMLRDSINGDIRILDPHSDVAVGLLDAEAVYPLALVRQVYDAYEEIGRPPVIIIPDKGAAPRIDRLFGEDVGHQTRVPCFKTRDPATGRLSGFFVSRPADVSGQTCIIFDDICDGGGTFVGLGKELRRAGAANVILFITHAIMSKGLVLDGIDHIYATDSFANHGTTDTFHTLSIEMETC